MPQTSPKQRATRSNSLSHSDLQQRATRSNSLSHSDFQQLLDETRSLKEIVMSIKDELKDMKVSVSTLTTKMLCIEESFSSIVETQQRHHSDIEIMKRKVHEMAEDQSQVLEEFEARELRKTNLVISGVPEKLDGTIEERKSYDKDSVSNILSDLQLSDCNIKAVYRIGRPLHNKSRLLRVICPDKESKLEILKKAKELRTFAKYRGIYINSDLTPKQQREQKQLRDEFRRRREANENVKIRHNKIIEIDDSKKKFQ